MFAYLEIENRHLLILTAFYALAMLIRCLKGKGAAVRQYGLRLLLFLIPAAIAAGWNLLLINHSFGERSKLVPQPERNNAKGDAK